MFLVEGDNDREFEPAFYNFAQINAFTVDYYYETDSFIEGYVCFNTIDGNSRKIIFRDKNKIDNLLDKVCRELSFMKIVLNSKDVFLNNENLIIFINLRKILIINLFKNAGGSYSIDLNFVFSDNKHIRYVIRNKEFMENILRRIRKRCINLDVVKKKKSRLEVLGIS